MRRLKFRVRTLTAQSYTASKEREGHFGAKSNIFCFVFIFCFFVLFSKCGSGHKDEEHAKGKVHSGMSAGRGTNAVRPEVRAARFFCLWESLRFEGRGLRQAPALGPALYAPEGDRCLN